MIASQICRHVKLARRCHHFSSLNWVKRFASHNVSLNQSRTSDPSASSDLQLNIEDSAVERLANILKENQFLRVFVEGGGCSGFQYKLEIDDNFDSDEDIVFDKDSAKVVADLESLKILNGATIEYHADLLRAGFRVKDIPQAEKGCSCGVSFSIITKYTGYAMGQYLAKLKRTTRTPQALVSNLDKALERKAVAPRHPSTVKAFEDLIQANPAFENASKLKNDNLHKRLESVKVDSTGAAPDVVLKSGKGIKKVNVLPEGKLSYDEIEELFINRKISPEMWTENVIAEKYKLDLKVAKNLLTHFSSFYIYKQENEIDLSSKGFLEKDEEMPTLISDSKKSY